MIRRIAKTVARWSTIVTVSGIATSALSWEPYHELGATIAYCGIVVTLAALATSVAGTGLDRTPGANDDSTSQRRRRDAHETVAPIEFD